MGGLCVNVGDMHDRLTRMTLTPKAVLHLAQKGHFFQISDSDIKDKSKANHLAKALVILQITWMIFQCLSRKISNLPLTVLEIHTLVHAGCALIMYSLWLNKPLDVQEPITVSTAGIEKYIALMLMQNHDSGVPPVGNLIAPVEFRPASLKGAKFGYWPGDQASEASYLIFNPRIAEKSTQSPTSDITGSNGNGVQDYPTAGPQASRRGIAITLNGSETEEQEHPLERLNADPLAGHCSIHSAPSRDSADQVIPSCNQIANIPRKFPKSCIDRRPVMSALKGPTLLKKGQRTQQATFDNKNPFLGVYSTLLAGVDVVSVVSTGEFTSNGIGPSAYITGEIREEYLPKRSADEKVLPLIVEIPKDLQARLPLGEIDPSSVQHYLRLEVALSKADHRRWELAGEALQEDYARGAIAPSDEHSYIGFKNDADTIRNAYLVTHPAMFQMHSYIREIMLSTMYGSENTSDQEHKGFLLVQGFYQSFLELEELSWGSATVVTFLPGFLYGGLHLTLWFYEFPSRGMYLHFLSHNLPFKHELNIILVAEHLLWRISSTSLIAIPLIPIFLSLAIQISRRRQSRELDSQQDIELHTRPDIRNNYASLGYIQKILIVLAFCAVLFIAALYLFARIFIILESFLSIRHVPISVYSDVTWSKYIPHL